jgi:hypothetical protein
MTIRGLDIPDETAELARWLEEQLAGDDLGSLVAELRAGHPADERDSATLESLLGDRLNFISTQGLNGIPAALLRGLIAHPGLLLELQERILIDGGGYWLSKPSSPRIAETAARQRESLTAQLSGSVAQPSASQPIAKRRSVIGWIVALAALVTIGLGLNFLVPRGSATEFAWNKPEAFQPAGRVEYLNRMATLAGEWFDRKPASKAELTARIQDFRRGCDRLISHADQLPPEDREWLLERCRVWSKKLDDNLAALKKGQPVPEVQREADATIRKLIDALKGRVPQVAWSNPRLEVHCGDES